MITCPSCGQTIPDKTDVCQFCHAQLGPPQQRPGKPGAAQPRGEPATGHGVPARVVRGLYYAISLYWLVSGLGHVIYILASSPSFYDLTVGITIHSVTTLCGLGLILRIEFVRGIVSFISALKILFGIIGLMVIIPSISTLGAIGLLLTVLLIIDIVTAGAMMWLIGETRTKALG